MIRKTLDLEIKSIDTPDTDVPLQDISSIEECSRCLFLEFEIGEKSEESSFLFGAVISTQNAYKIACKKYPKAVLSPILFVEDWNWDSVYDEIVFRVRISQGESWCDTIENLKRYFCFQDEEYTKEH